MEGMQYQKGSANMNRQWSRVSGAVAGVVFALLIFLSVAVVDPLREATDAELLEWWSDDGKLQEMYLSMYFRLAAIPFLLAFLVPFRSKLRSAEGADGWSDLVSSSGLIFAAMLAVSVLARGAIAQSVAIDDEPPPGVDTLRFVTEFSYAAFGIAAIPAAAVMVGVASAIVLRTKAFAAWFGWLGAAVAVVSLLMSAALMGAFASPLLLIWFLAASFGLVRISDSEVPQLADSVAGQPV
jgi:hypothetical protein